MNNLACRSLNGNGEVDFFSNTASMFRLMWKIWKKDLDTLARAHDTGNDRQEGLDHLEGLEELSLDPNLAMEWIGTPFLMGMLSDIPI